MFGGSQVLASTPSTQGSSSTFVMGENGKVAGGGVRKPGEETTTCLPVTIRSVEVAIAQRLGSGDVLFYGTEPSILLVVGLVESVNQQATSLELVINDATGRLPARYYTSDAEHDLVDVKPGSYVSLAAQIRTSPSPHFSIVTGRLVRSADEISYHMIESAHEALKLGRIQAGLPTKMRVDPVTPAKRLVPEDIGSDKRVSPAKSAQIMDVDMNVTTHLQKLCEVAASAHPIAGHSAVKASGGLSGEALRCAVLEALGQAPKVEIGLSMSDLCAKFTSSTETNIRAALAALVDDGEVFNTLDDDTFASL